MRNIEIIGVVNNGNSFSPEIIEQALDTAEIRMAQGEVFTGRPGTIIHATESEIVKLKFDSVFKDQKIARKWIAKQLEKEQQFNIHHPQKTWFYVEINGDYVPGNITPLLLPLHIELLDDSKIVDERLLEEWRVNLLLKTISFYLFFAANHNLRLDEGLSNFGIDDNGTLYYLDDDLYSWDEFITFSHMLGVYFRYLNWITLKNANFLAESIAALIIQHFTDNQWVRVVIEQLNGVFVPHNLKQIFAEFNETMLNAIIDKRKNTLLAGSSGSVNTEKVIKIKPGKIAILADIHANLPALQATLLDIKERKIKQAILLGDIVGYGPHPSECIDLIRKVGIYTIKGNHDHAAGRSLEDGRFSKTAKMSLEWTISQLNEVDKKWLLDLPPIFKNENFMAVHGSPIDHTFFNGYVYHMTYEANLDYMEKNNIRICFHGHTHSAGIYSRQRKSGDDILIIDNHVRFEDGNIYLACPGSIGQPRDGVSGARYSVYDTESHELEHIHISYSVESVINDMRTRKMPEALIEFQSKLLRGENNG